MTKFERKFMLWIFCLCFIIIEVKSQFSSDIYPKENFDDSLSDAIQFLREYDGESKEICYRVATSEWKYSLNATDFNKRKMKEQQNIASKFDCISWRRAARFDSSRILDSNIRRQLGRIVQQGRCGLGDDKFLEITHLISLMKENYHKARICPYRGDSIDLNQNVQYANEFSTHSNYVSAFSTFCDLRLEPDLNRIMERSRNPDELKYVWTEWREKVGPPNRNTFMRYIDLANQAANKHGFKDAGDQMRSIYEDPDFFFTVQDLWGKIQPLYRQLFTFVRRGLHQRYGENVVREDGPIPAHILGNMWTHNWRNIIDLIVPETQTPDVTGELLKKGFTPTKIFQYAEEFFTSMGMPPMSPEFWRNSIIEKPNDNFNQCTPSAWDFCNNIDFRIKQCTSLTLEDFVNAHHELTHIHYYMQYANQPFVYRESPNPAFHEAVSHAISLSVGGPVHLQKMGLLPSPISAVNGNSILNIEYLLNVALDKLPFMAYSIALEKWRWYIFEKWPEKNFNGRFWELRLRYQGVIPPTPRSNSHFDAGAKYHVISDQDYIKYFVSTILQFQIFSELCLAANHEGPLHTCDIYRSREAGRLLTNFMSKGAFLSAPQLIKLITRGKTSKLSVEPLLEFFKPLSAWLEVQNKDEPKIGWNSRMEDIEMFGFHSYINSTSNKVLFEAILLPLTILVVRLLV